jgi:hypothetical protein
MNFTGLNASTVKHFGISLVPQQERVILPELIKFYLYPRFVDEQNELYTNFTVQRGFRFHRFSIYYATHVFDDGFRVEDIECYSKLVGLMRKQTSTNPAVSILVENSGQARNVTVHGFLKIVHSDAENKLLKQGNGFSTKSAFTDIFL